MISMYPIISQRDLCSICTGNIGIEETRHFYLTNCRNCSLGKSDIDVVVAVDWWRKGNHRDDLETALTEVGFKKHLTFGNISQLGYEESYMEDGIKVLLMEPFFALQESMLG